MIRQSSGHDRSEADKIAGISADIPLQKVCLGNEEASLAVVGWGSTHGAIHQAVKRACKLGLDVSHIHVRYIAPLPSNLGALLGKFDQILVPEMNTGQFVKLLRQSIWCPPKAWVKWLDNRLRSAKSSLRFRKHSPTVR